jgi:hypothetical protein
MPRAGYANRSLIAHEDYQQQLGGGFLDQDGVALEVLKGRMLIMCETLPAAATASTLSSLAEAEVWVALMLVAIPTALTCATVIVLVLAVERRDRVQAVKALPPVVKALGIQAVSRMLRHGRVRSKQSISVSHPQGERARQFSARSRPGSDLDTPGCAPPEVREVWGHGER